MIYAEHLRYEEKAEFRMLRQFIESAAMVANVNLQETNVFDWNFYMTGQDVPQPNTVIDAENRARFYTFQTY